MTTALMMIDRNDTFVRDANDFSVWNMANTSFDSIFDQDDYSLAMLEQVAANSDVPTIMLEQLMYHPVQAIRLTLAGNASLPTDALMVLAQDVDLEVRMTLASNRQAPIEVLQLLTIDSSSYVSTRAINTLARVSKSAGITQIQNRRCNHKQLA